MLANKRQRILIVGGGFAGLRALFHLSRIDGLEIIVLDPRETSLVKPALPEVALSGKSVENVRFPLEPVVRRAGARFVRAGVDRVLASERVVVLGDGTTLEYDYLLIAAGARKAYDRIPGYDEYGYSPCDDFQAPRLAQAIEAFEGGPIAIGAAPSIWGQRVEVPRLSAPCEGPVGEVMFMLDAELRRRGIRECSTIRVFSPGREFFEDVGSAVHAALAPAIEESGIEVVPGKQISAIHADHVEFTDSTHWPSELSILIPPYTGNPLVFASEGLGDEAGFVPTDRQMRHLDFPKLFAVGDGTALSMPKLGHIAIHQADIACATLRRELTGDGEIPDFAPEIFCIMNRGGHDAMLILSNDLYGGDVDRCPVPRSG